MISQVLWGLSFHQGYSRLTVNDPFVILITVPRLLQTLKLPVISITAPISRLGKYGLTVNESLLLELSSSIWTMVHRRLLADQTFLLFSESPHMSIALANVG